MHAIERLRYVARAGEVESTELATEAALALAGLADDRRALVLACRRLLGFHPGCGALWWVCAHMLEASDVTRCARTLVGELEDDPSIDELFTLPSSGDVVVAESSRQIVRALSLRVDLPIRLVGPARSLRLGMRYFGDSVLGSSGYLPDEGEVALDGATMVVIEALGASALGIFCSAHASALAERAIARDVPLYVLAGVGRILPLELFAAMQSQLATQPESGAFGALKTEAELSRVGSDYPFIDCQATRVIEGGAVEGLLTERGLRTPSVAFHASPMVSHLRCPVPGELLGAFGTTGYGS